MQALVFPYSYHHLWGCRLNGSLSGFGCFNESDKVVEQKFGIGGSAGSFGVKLGGEKGLVLVPEGENHDLHK